MSNRKFRHEMSEDGSHRIVDLTTNTIGPWALYDSPAFLFIDNKVFSALTSYYRGIDSSIPPVETVFEMINYQTERGETKLASVSIFIK